VPRSTEALGADRGASTLRGPAIVPGAGLDAGFISPTWHS
jgi:hypothetical protein